jgi:hypothetical protein
MEKNWLIRTKARQILGPVGKQKILEFVKKGSLTADDEISSGNGYWFSIKEKDLLEKYIYGDLPQGFNPITEAPNVLTSNTNVENEMTGSLNPNTMPKEKPAAPEPVAQDEPIAVPEGGDLDYPDMGASAEAAQVPSSDDLAFPDSSDLDYPDMGGAPSDDITMVGAVPKPTPAPQQPAAPEVSASPEPAPAVGHVADQVPSTDEEGKLPEGEDLDYPDMGMSAAPAAAAHDYDQTDPSFEMPVDEDITKDDIVFSEQPPVPEEESPEIPSEEPEVVKKKVKKKVKSTKKKKKQRNDRYLLYVLIGLILVVLYGAFYYFTNIVNSEARISNPFINNVYAQTTISSLGKKKTLLN